MSFDIDFGGDEFGVFSVVMTGVIHAVGQGIMNCMPEIAVDRSKERRLESWWRRLVAA